MSKVAKSPIGDILRRYKETQTIKRKRGGGRKKGFVDKNKVNSIIESIATQGSSSNFSTKKIYALLRTTKRNSKRISHSYLAINIFISQKVSVSNKFKYIQIEKFAKKILVWQAICSCGLKSAPFITRKTLTSNCTSLNVFRNTFWHLLTNTARQLSFGQIWQ